MSKADELAKLSTLREQGSLSEAEFEHLKAELLYTSRIRPTMTTGVVAGRSSPFDRMRTGTMTYVGSAGTGNGGLSS